LILLALSIPVIGAIWWWTARRSRQAPGNAELRESSAPAPLVPTLAEIPADKRAGAGEPRAEPGEARTPMARTAGLERRAQAPEEPHAEHAPQPRPFGIPPLEPLSIRTAEFDDVPALDQPMLVHADPIDFNLDSSRAVGAPRFAQTPAAPATAPPAETRFTAVTDTPDDADADAEADAIDEPEDFAHRDDLEPTVESSAVHAAPTRSPSPAAQPGTQLSLGAMARPAPAAPPKSRPATEHSDRHAPVAQPNTSEQQKIVTLRVCAVGDARWSGTDLLATLEVHGLAHGRYQVFHRKHSDGRSIFCVASLVEPGTFDLSNMPNEEFRGISLFAVLPGPLEPVGTIEDMLATARDLARALSGTLQDAKGIPFSPQRVETLLQDVARFQAQLA
jgi:cell division protein ZipA